MPTPRWYDLRYHADHAQIMASDARFILMRAGRRSGKTEIGKRKLVMQLPIKKPWHDPKYFFAAPTRQQAKEIAWEDLKALVPKNWLRGRPSETELKINTVFGSSLQVVGLDQPQRIEGKGYDAGYIDEMSDTKPQALSVSIFPAMADRHGSLMMGGVPKRAGVGAVFFNRLFDMARDAGVMEGTILAFREINNWKFSKPIYIGDTIRVVLTIKDTKAMPRLGGGAVVIELDVQNQDDDTVMKGTWSALMASRPE